MLFGIDFVGCFNEYICVLEYALIAVFGLYTLVLLPRTTCAITWYYFLGGKGFIFLFVPNEAKYWVGAVLILLLAIDVSVNYFDQG